MPLRIAHVITRMIIGGAQENTLLNCRDLISAYGDDVLLITGPSLGPEGSLLSAGELQRGRAGELPLQLVPALQRPIHPARDWSAYRAIYRRLREFSPDVVHTHSAKGGLLGRRAAWNLQVPAVVHTVHGAPFHPYQSPMARQFFRSCERWAAARCHHLISVADAMTELMVQAGVATADKFTTIHSGMEVEPFLQADSSRAAVRARYGLTDQQVVIGKIARLFHLKGHDDLITAAVAVAQRHPQVRFLLVGDGILRETHQRRIDALGLRQHFIFTGLVQPGQIPELLGAMDVVVHTSLREGLARVLPQALLAGKPVVSFDIDGAREVTLPGRTGYLIPPRDTAQLAQAMIELVADPQLRYRLGRAGQQQFAEQFDHRVMTARIRRLYERLLAT